MNGIRLGTQVISYYGLLIVIGLLTAGLLGYIIAVHFQMSVNDYFILAAYGLGGGMAGAKLLYLFVIWDHIQWNLLGEPEYLNNLFQGGFVFYGGLAGGIAAMLLAGRLHRISVWDYLNTMIPCLPVVQGFGRIGCWLSGCCYGIPYKGLGAITYKSNYYAPDGISLFPVQLAEAVLCWVLAIFLVIYIWKSYGEKAFSIYIISYAILRFLLEFLRGDYLERGIWLGLSTSQWISAAGIILTVIYLSKRRVRHRESYK